MKHKFIISIHIPKTAGTSLAYVFDRVFNRRVIYDYDGYEHASEPNALIKQNRAFVQEYFDVLHGHFYATKYQKVFSDAAFVATLRHPVERVISQYLHEFNEDSSDAYFHDDIRSGRMTLADFAEQPNIGDAMSKHLQGRSIDKYDALLISERMWESCHVLSHKVRPLVLAQHFTPGVLPKINERNTRKSNVSISDEMRQAVYNRTQADNEVYRRAVEMLNRDLKLIDR